MPWCRLRLAFHAGVFSNDISFRHSACHCRYNALIFVPYQLERLLWYGLLLCLDSFLVGCSCSLALHTLLQTLCFWHEGASANSCSHAPVVLSLTQSCPAGPCLSREAGPNVCPQCRILGQVLPSLAQ